MLLQKPAVMLQLQPWMENIPQLTLLLQFPLQLLLVLIMPQACTTPAAYLHTRIMHGRVGSTDITVTVIIPSTRVAVYP